MGGESSYIARIGLHRFVGKGGVCVGVHLVLSVSCALTRNGWAGVFCETFVSWVLEGILLCLALELGVASFVPCVVYSQVAMVCRTRKMVHS